MAKVVGVINTAHTPFCYMAPERWNEVRSNRSLREDVPLDSLEENLKKKERIEAGFAKLREVFNEMKADVAVVCGDDRPQPVPVVRSGQCRQHPGADGLPEPP